MRRLAIASSALLLAPLLASCGGGSTGPCGAGRSLEILAPADGERVEAASVELTIHACHFDLADRIVVQLVQPFDTAYAYVMSDDGEDSTIAVTVPTISGTMEFRAQSEDGSVWSESVTIEAAPP